MNKLLVAGTIVTCLFAGCTKDFSKENFIPDITTTRPDFTRTTLSSVAGFITSDFGIPVEFAVVSGGTQSTLTNEFGYFELENVTMPAEAGFVKVTKAGYFDGFRTFETASNKQTFVRIQLIPRIETGTVNSTTGGTVQTADGAKITIPANAVVYNITGTAYTGTVHVAAHWLNPTGGHRLSLNMPGDLRGIDSAGYLRGLETFGMMAVELTDDGGQQLQIAAGKKASVSMPIPAALQATAPASIAFWSFNETSGLWKQEGMAVKTGSNYIGEAGHFSFWNCDVPFPLVRFKAQIVNNKLIPLANVSVRITKVGDNGPRYGYTDSSGNIIGSVPANSQLLFELLSSCGDVVFSRSFTTTTASTDLGTIAITENKREVTITGQALNCSNQPLLDGTLFIGTDSLYHRIPVKNGVFQYSFFVCKEAATPATYMLLDNVANVQSASQDFVLGSGLINLGTLTACGVSAETFIIYKYDNNTYNLNTRDSTWSFYNGNNVTDIFSSDYDPANNSNNFIRFKFTGAANQTGPHNLSSLSFNKPVIYSNQNITPAVAVAITEYGTVNQFIKGSFNMVVRDSANVNHNFECTFRVRRTQ